MSSRLSTRLSVFLASAAVAAATLVPVLPAAAEEVPTPEPTVSETPVAAGTPSAEPAPEPEPTVESTQPTEPEAPATTVVVGSFAEIEGHGVEPLPAGVAAFDAGEAWLLLDTTSTGTPDGVLEVTVAVPTGVDGGDTQALAAASTSDPLTVIETQSAERLSAMVNTMPNVAATHRIYAVLVTPSNVAGTSAAANQSATAVAAAVAHTDDYWNQQSSGSVRFDLAGTTAWYKGADTCATQAGSINLWNAAAGVAATQLGYVAGPNTHLVLFFPSGSGPACGGALGLGSVGATANVGGRAWVVGTDAAIEKATLSHELGHNLSLGHANWMSCTSASGTSGCTAREYGDLTDVMGFGQTGVTGGALSSAQAIRAGIWPSSAWKVAPKGTSSYTLLPVSKNTGLRGVVVQDRYGTDYFVEFRNYGLGDEDQRTATGACTTSCSSITPGVRILILDTSEGLKGVSGDGSYVISRSSTVMDFKAGQSYAFNGMTIKVTSLTGASAKISVTRNFTSGYTDDLFFERGVTYDGTPRVGDSYGLLLGESWTADSRSFQWYRNGVAISGATKQYYKLVNADYGKRITVRLSVVSKGYQTFTQTSTLTSSVAAAVPAAGSVSISTTTPRKVVTTGYPWGTTFAYQWYRAGAKITGATSSTYTPVSADAGKLVHVVVTPTSAGNTIAPVTTTGKDYGLAAASTPVISGTAKVGTSLTVADVSYSSSTDGTIPVARTYVWYRSGVPIKGATSASYALVAADLGATISVKVTASAPGYASRAITTAATAKVVAGTIAGSRAVPVLSSTLTGTTVKWTGALPAGSVTESGVGYKYQWYRSAATGGTATAITNATTASYTLTSADRGKLVWLRITATKTGYTSVPLETNRQLTSITAGGTPSIMGDIKTNSTFSISMPNFTYPDDATVIWPPVSYQWFSNGTAIPGATGATFTPSDAFLGKVITVKTTGSHTVGGLQLMPLTLTSSATQKLGANVMAGTVIGVFTPAHDGLVLSVPSPATTGITEPGVTATYQWYRHGDAVPKATKSTYTLTSADRGKVVTVRVVLTKPGYTTVVKQSRVFSYTVTASGAPVITDSGAGFRVGTMLSVEPRTFSAKNTTVTATETHVWYRNGVAIAGQTGSTYALVAADLGKKITVKVTAASAGLLSSSATSAATPAVTAGTIVATDSAPTVTSQSTATGRQLTAEYTGTVTAPASGATVSYQWLRNDVPISGATGATYTLTAADNNQYIAARAVVSAPGYNTRTLIGSTSGVYLRVAVAGGALAVSDSTPVVGQTLSAASTLEFTAGPNPYEPAPSLVKYQWYVNGAAVSGATKATFKVPSTAKGKTVAVRMTVNAPGFTPIAVTSAATGKVK